MDSVILHGDVPLVVVSGFLSGPRGRAGLLSLMLSCKAGASAIDRCLPDILLATRPGNAAVLSRRREAQITDAAALERARRVTLDIRRRIEAELSRRGPRYQALSEDLIASASSDEEQRRLLTHVDWRDVFRVALTRSICDHIPIALSAAAAVAQPGEAAELLVEISPMSSPPEALLKRALCNDVDVLLPAVQRSMILSAVYRRSAVAAMKLADATETHLPPSGQRHLQVARAVTRAISYEDGCDLETSDDCFRAVELLTLMADVDGAAWTKASTVVISSIIDGHASTNELAAVLRASSAQALHVAVRAFNNVPPAEVAAMLLRGPPPLSTDRIMECSRCDPAVTDDPDIVRQYVVLRMLVACRAPVDDLVNMLFSGDLGPLWRASPGDALQPFLVTPFMNSELIRVLPLEELRRWGNDIVGPFPSVVVAGLLESGSEPRALSRLLPVPDVPEGATPRLARALRITRLLADVGATETLLTAVQPGGPLARVWRGALPSMARVVASCMRSDSAFAAVEKLFHPAESNILEHMRIALEAALEGDAHV